MDDRAQQMVLVGYHSTGAYKMYDPIQKKIVKSRDVVIDESKSWNWSENDEGNGERVIVIDFDIAQDNNEQTDVPAVVELEVQDVAGPVRSLQRDKQRSIRLDGFDIFPGSAITTEGDLIHTPLLAKVEPVSFEQAMKHLQ